jgi:hypothetical protein
MDDPETVPESVPVEPEPALPGASIGAPKPDVVADPITDSDIPVLQDRRRPLP